MPNPVHNFKNIASSLMKCVFCIKNDMVVKYNLLSNKIDFNAVKQVFKIKKIQELKIALKLKNICLIQIILTKYFQVGV